MFRHKNFSLFLVTAVTATTFQLGIEQLNKAKIEVITVTSITIN